MGYKKDLRDLQIALVRYQQWVIKTGAKALILMMDCDARPGRPAPALIEPDLARAPDSPRKGRDADPDIIPQQIQPPA